MMSFAHANTLLYAMVCGSLCFVIAFMYKRKGSRYKFIPSLLAFAIAAKAGVEWLTVMGSILLYGYWPHIPPVLTGALAILLIMAVRAKGNVSQILSHLRFKRLTH